MFAGFVLQLLSKTLTFTLHLSLRELIDHLCFNPILSIGLIHKSRVITYVIAWKLQARSLAPSLIYKVSFFIRKIIRISVCQN